MEIFHTSFEILNEAIVCVGSGILGFCSLFFNGEMHELIQYSLLTIAGVGSLFYMISSKQELIWNENNVVLITGCDSGLGYNLALKCYGMKMTVIAACLNSKSEGAMKLRELCNSKHFHVIQLDITNIEMIKAAREFVEKLLKTNANLSFTALVNNAGVMTFGEFEWQTLDLIRQQLSVNLLGTMFLTKAFLPIIRLYKGRIINVTSHCSLQSLPSLSVYAASKVGLKFWADSLRMEMKKYGVHIIDFIPGSFVMTSNIMARQQEDAIEMKRQFSSEQLNFYGSYFDDFNTYLKSISGRKKIEDMAAEEKLMKKFQQALTHDQPYSVYKYEPLRYTFYYTLFKITPAIFKDWLVTKFVCLPAYEKSVPISLPLN